MLSFQFLWVQLWALVLRPMVLGPLVLLTTIRLAFSVRSTQYSRKEKLLGAVVAELISEKCDKTEELNALQLQWERLQQETPQRARHSKPDDGLVDVDIEAPNYDSVVTHITLSRQVQELVREVSALTRQSKDQEEELQAMLKEVKALQESVELRARESSQLVSAAKQLYNWGPCSGSHLLL